MFTHKGHISTIRNSFHTVWNKGLPESGHMAAEAPFFERYDARFNPQTGQGDVEIWVPVRG